MVYVRYFFSEIISRAHETGIIHWRVIGELDDVHDNFKEGINGWGGLSEWG